VGLSSAESRTESRTLPLPIETKEHRAKLEDDHSAITIRLKEKHGIKVPVSEVREWEPAARHDVAQWLEKLEDEMPKFLLDYPNVPIWDEKSAAWKSGEAEKSKGKTVNGKAPSATTDVRVHVVSKDEKIVEHKPDSVHVTSESVTVVIGEDTYGLPKFSNFKVGGFSMTIALSPGEHPGEKIRKARELLHEQYDEEFILKCDKVKKNLIGLRNAGLEPS
jgi:hypothetical protein